MLYLYYREGTLSYQEQARIFWEQSRDSLYDLKDKIALFKELNHWMERNTRSSLLTHKVAAKTRKFEVSYEFLQQHSCLQTLQYFYKSIDHRHTALKNGLYYEWTSILRVGEPMGIKKPPQRATEPLQRGWVVSCGGRMKKLPAAFGTLAAGS